jgi:hypothetical protein
MRKYLKDHAVKVLQTFDAKSGKGTNFGLPLDTHIKDYCKQYKSRKSLAKKSVRRTERSCETSSTRSQGTKEC